METHTLDPLPSLPLELWQNITTQVYDSLELWRKGVIWDANGSQTLHNLCLTCRALCALSQPLLFRVIIFKAGAVESPPELISRSQQLLRSLEENTNARRWPKVFNIHHNPFVAWVMSMNPERKAESDNLQHTLERIVSLVEDIHSMELWKVCITPGLYRGLCEFKRLHSLRIRDPRPSRDAPLQGIVDGTTLASLPVVELELKWDAAPNSVGTYEGLHKTLFELLRCQSIKSLDADLTIASAALADYPALRTNLNKLSVAVPWRLESHSQLMSLLEACPNVTTLIIRGTRIDTSKVNISVHIPSTHLPYLSSVIAPWKLAIQFVPGRPVKHFEAMFPQGSFDLAEENLQLLASGIEEVSLTNIRSEVGLQFLVQLAKVVPSVKQLRLRGLFETIMRALDTLTASDATFRCLTLLNIEHEDDPPVRFSVPRRTLPEDPQSHLRLWADHCAVTCPALKQITSNVGAAISVPPSGI